MPGKNRPESFTPDLAPIVGQAPGIDNYFVAAGMNSVGIMSSAGIGDVLADWIITGAEPRDLWGVDIARADPRADSRVAGRAVEPRHTREAVAVEQRHRRQSLRGRRLRQRLGAGGAAQETERAARVKLDVRHGAVLRLSRTRLR